MPSKRVIARQKAKALIEQMARETEALPLPALAAIAPALRDALREVTMELRDILSGNKPATPYTVQMHRRAMVQVHRAWEEAGQHLADTTELALTKGTTAAMEVALRHAQQWWAEMELQFEGTVSPIALKEAAIIAHGEKALMKRIAGSAERYAGQVGDDIRRQIAVGLLRGEDIDKITKRLIRLGGPRTAGIEEGLFTRYNHWANRLVRTEVVNAYNVGHEEAIAKIAKEDGDGGVMKRWDAALDGRVCLTCRAMNGELREPDEVFSDGAPHPPDHPYCRCTVVAWRKEWGDL